MSIDDLEYWEPEPEKPVYRVDPKDEKFKALCEPGFSKSFDCPACGIQKNVDPVMAGDEWLYYGQCSHCGQTWVNVYALMRKCESCGKRVRMTSRNPEGRCKCDGVTRPF